MHLQQIICTICDHCTAKSYYDLQCLGKIGQHFVPCLFFSKIFWSPEKVEEFSKFESMKCLAKPMQAQTGVRILKSQFTEENVTEFQLLFFLCSYWWFPIPNTIFFCKMIEFLHTESSHVSQQHIAARNGICKLTSQSSLISQILHEISIKSADVHNGSMTIETNSFETINLRPHSFETTTFETTFILDLFIWDRVFLRPVHLSWVDFIWR